MKKDNKGFSLVELIIVIAIMAILVGIVGSQVLPYLNKSREAKDQQIVSSWVTAALSAYSANAATCVDTEYVIQIVVDNNGKAALATVTTGTNGTTELKDSFNELAGLSAPPTFASNTYKKAGTVKITIKPSNNPVVYISSWGISAASASTKELIAK
jgi:type IV pilus assembly protein PilA